MHNGFRTGLLLLALGATCSSVASAHEIPSEVVVRMLAKAEQDRFRLLVRVPLDSMRDVEVPEFGPGYLDLERLEPQLPELARQWMAPFIEVHEEGRRLEASVVGTQVSLPSDRSFTSFGSAAARLAESLPPNTDLLVWGQVSFDVELQYAVDSAESRFSLRPGLQHLGARVTTSLQFELPDGRVRAYSFSGDPGAVPLDPSWFQAVGRFVVLGFEHILDGPDHLLFLFCLVIPLRRLRPLVLAVTAFTVAHSVTLIVSALGHGPQAGWFPPFVEVAIAASVVYMALENIAGGARLRWLVALGFGLVHGFGFAFVLRETLQLAGSHLLTSLLAFNVGVELGQLLVVGLLAGALAGLMRLVKAERTVVIVLSALAAHHSWHWLLERYEVLGRFDVQWGREPLTYWIAGITLLVVGGGIWQVARRRANPGSAAPPAAAA